MRQGMFTLSRQTVRVRDRKVRPDTTHCAEPSHLPFGQTHKHCSGHMSSNRKEIRAFLSSWVNTDTSPHFAVLVQGEWGCGKTYFIKSIADEKGFTRRRIIYASLFGLDTIDALELQLFYASASSTAKLAYRGAKIAASVLKGTFRIDLNGDSAADGSIDAKLDGIERIIQTALKNLDGSVLILDDLERTGIPHATLLGMINAFVEHSDIRVILIANTKKITDEDFRRFNEKVVGQSFELAADSEGALATFIENVSPKKIREAIHARRDAIETLFRQSTHNNLRALRHYVWQLSMLLSKLHLHHLQNNQLVDALIHQMFIFFMEFKLDLSEGSLGLSTLDLKGRHDDETSEVWFVYDYSVDRDKPPSQKQKTLRKYANGGEYGISTVITVKQWISILETGVVDTDWLNREIERCEIVAGARAWPAWKRLWHLHDWDFSDGSHVEFESDVADIFEKLGRAEYTDPHEFLHVAGILLQFSRYGVVSNRTEELLAEMKKYADQNLAPQADYDMCRSVITEDFTSSFGLGYAGRNNPEFRELLGHLRTGLSKRIDEWKELHAADYLLGLLKTDILRFLGNLTIVNSRPEQRFLREPILHRIAPSRFVEVWLTLPRQSERGLAGALDERYSYRPELLDQEAVWWENVRHELCLRKLSEQTKPRAYQIARLIESVDQEILWQWHQKRLRVLLTQVTCEPADIAWTLRQVCSQARIT